MGWWKDDDGILIGDSVLDLAEDFLRSVSEAFEEEQGRKPTLKELLAGLRAVIRSQAETYLDEEPGLLVAEIVAKTRSRKRPQLNPGDIFTVPLGNGEYAFGRLTPQLSVADFFELRSSSPIRASKLKNIPTFRLAGLLMLDPLKEGRWSIIDSLPYQDEEFEIQRFKIANQVGCGDKVVNGFIDTSSRLRPATADELLSLPQYSLWNAEMVEQKLRERLLK